MIPRQYRTIQTLMEPYGFRFQNLGSAAKYDELVLNLVLPSGAHISFSDYNEFLNWFEIAKITGLIDTTNT